MKRPLLFSTLSLLALSLAGVCAWQQAQLRSKTETIAGLEAAARESARQAQALQAQATDARQQKEWLEKEAKSLRAKLENARTAGAEQPQASPEAPQPNGIENLRRLAREAMRDPFVKEMMLKGQEKQAARKAKRIAQDLGLSPEREEELKTLLMDQHEAMMERQFSSESGDPVELGKGLSALRASQQEELKRFLGDTGYQQYQANEKTRSETAELNRLKSGFGEAPLQDTQAQTLQQLIREEQGRVASPVAGSERAALSAEQIEQEAAWREQLNQRVVARATAFLSPTQIKALQAYQAEQTQQWRRSTEMAKRFLGGQP